ncbi:MAG: FkbM family methyltransferase [Candidatus Hodarchaeota archaeon]
MELFLETVKPDMVVLDIGVYIGYYTLLAAREVGPGERVYAFEPDPLSYRLLKHNIYINGYRNIMAVPKAVSSESCLVQLYQHPYDPTMSSLLARNGWERATLAECTSADKFLGEQKVDLVKMDVEGAELQTLQGMVRTIEKSAGMTMFVEFNPVVLNESGSPPGELISEIRKLGFDCIIRLDEQRNSQGEFELCNLCCTRGGY